MNGIETGRIPACRRDASNISWIGASRIFGEERQGPSIKRVKTIKPQMTQIYTDDDSRILMNPGIFKTKREEDAQNASFQSLLSVKI
jgi:hypothetical protein